MAQCIKGEDFHKNVGKTVLIPHPTRPLQVLPVKVLIKGVDKKKVILQEVGTNKTRTANYSKDKNKYIVVS